jgi:1-acyl-sn-glycerol-3-phosphate acyltransferase
MDPAVIGFTVQRPVHFFAKAPLFDVPVFGALMRALGMVPAHRGQDDKASVRKNLETLDLGAKYLARGEAVGIFPEGKTHDREGIEQVRTGATRIAWSAVQSGAAVKIVPLGLNYERKERFRSSVWVRVGEPIDANKFFRERGEEERKAQRSFTEEIDARLKEAVIHLNEPRLQSLLDDLDVLLPPDDGEVRNSIAALHQRKRIADALNFFFANDPIRSETVAKELEQHHATLAAAGLNVSSPVLRFGVARLTIHLLLQTLWLSVGFVPALAGTLHHIIPFAITRYLVRLAKHPGRATIAFNRLAIGLPIYAIWYAVVWSLLAKYTQQWIASLWTVLMPFCGVAALHYAWLVSSTGRAWWQELKMIFNPTELRPVRSIHTRLRHEIQKLRDEYRLKTR